MCWKSSSAASVQLQMLSAARIMKISIFKRRIGLFIFSRKYSSFLHKYSYLLNIYRINLLSSFLKKGRRYHMQLHWSSWRTIPAHLGSWMHGTLYQYYCYMCIYVYCLFCFEIKRFSFSYWYTAGRRNEKQLRHWLYLEFAQSDSVLFVEYEYYENLWKGKFFIFT